MNHDGFNAWIGRSETVTEQLCPGPRAKLAALLDHDGRHWPVDAIPPLGQWLYTNMAVPQSQIGIDGHPERGRFSPPISFPRRMWASSNLEFHAPLRVDGVLHRESTIVAVEPKAGRTGKMIFVTVRHVLSVDNVRAVTEDQTIVYRDGALSGSPAPVVSVEPVPGHRLAIERALKLDPIALFRYSALTFNSHRIHYVSIPRANDRICR